MSIENIKGIRLAIALALEYEAKSGDFHRGLLEQTAELPNAIDLGSISDTNEAKKALKQLVIRYVQNVPEFLEAIYQITGQACIDRDIEPFLKIAEEFFLKPPDIVEDHRGLAALMEAAYLAHRLMEELNDRFIQHCGIPLVPLDMTRANVIVHHLIGERFANDLDNIVHYAADSLVKSEQLFKTPGFQKFARDHSNRGWSEELRRWPCLTQDLEVGLNIGGNRITPPPAEEDFTVH
tara:strand:- start:1742 stop:2452 length:711 start_codon:yes stop_codon:yes gene_type:complete